MAINTVYETRIQDLIDELGRCASGQERKALLERLELPELRLRVLARRCRGVTGVNHIDRDRLVARIVASFA